jgi:hypothetical protein
MLTKPAAAAYLGLEDALARQVPCEKKIYYFFTNKFYVNNTFVALYGYCVSFNSPFKLQE